MASVDSRDIDQRLARARAQLMTIPGALSVGLGYRRRDGAGTGEPCWMVFVRSKRPLSEVPQDEVIPRDLFGLRTDVLSLPRLTRLQCAITDRFDVLVGGLLISNLKNRVATGSLVGDSLGTMGFFGTINGSSSLDNVVLLTNHHVLSAAGGAVGDTVYQPRVVAGSPPTVADPDLHPIGTIHTLLPPGNHQFAYPNEAEKPYHLDCGTARINTSFSSCCGTNCGIKFRNAIHGLQNTPLGSAAIEGVARVTNATIAAASQPPKVFKVGKDTGWTTGKLVAAEASLPDLDHPGVNLENSIVIEDVGPNCGGGQVFGTFGDSGAVIVDEHRNIIGLLFGFFDLPGNPIYVASNIHPVLAKLGITLVSTRHTAGASGSPSSLEASLMLDERSGDVARATALRDEILMSEHGRRYRLLVERHMEEVAHLVNRVRPVTVAWQRSHGPDFLGHVLHASRHADHAVPRELNGITRDEAFERLMDALARHGSGALRADVERHADEVRSLVRQVDDIETLADRVRAASGAECAR